MEKQPEILEERRGAVGEVMLNRPLRRNALTREMLDALHLVVEQFIADPEVRVILLHAAPPAFCSGAEMESLTGDRLQSWGSTFAQRWEELHATLWVCPKPVVCAMEGPAIAIGATLALACDFLVSSRSARMEFVEARIGLPSLMSGVWLQARFGAARALELTLNARSMDGDQLAGAGIAVEAVKDGKALDGARALAERLSKLDPGAVAATKAGVRTATNIGDFREHLAAVQAAAREATGD